MEKNLLQRINELAKKKKTVGLTAEEQAEQKKLYKIYLGEIRQQFSATLDNVSVIEIKKLGGGTLPSGTLSFTLTYRYFEPEIGG